MRSTRSFTDPARSSPCTTSSVFSRGLQLAENLRLDLLVLGVVQETGLAHLLGALKSCGRRSRVVHCGVGVALRHHRRRAAELNSAGLGAQFLELTDAALLSPGLGL